MQKLLLSPRELAEAIGLSEQTIYNRHSSGGSLPPSMKLGRLLRFPVEGVYPWILAQMESETTQPIPKRKQGRPTKAEQFARKLDGQKGLVKN